MFQAILPLIEGLAGEGGLLSSVGASAGGMGGLEGLAGKLGFAKSFGNQGELGAGPQKISDLQGLVEKTRAAIDANNRQQSQHAQSFRDEEKNSLYGDPAHLTAQADLTNENQALAAQLRQQQQQLSALSSRVTAPLNPSSASFSRAATIAGGAAAISFAPSILRGLPGVQAAGNVGSFFAGPTNSGIARQMAGTVGGLVSSPLGGMAQGAALGGLAGPGGAVVGAALGALAGTASELSTLPKKLVDWGEALVSSQRHLAPFSAELSRAMGEAERRQMSRDIGSAGRTGGATAELSRTLQDIHDTLQPVKDAVTVTISHVLSYGIETLNAIINVVPLVVRDLSELPVIGKRVAKVEKMAEEFANKGKTSTLPFADFLREAHNNAAKRLGGGARRNARKKAGLE